MTPSVVAERRRCSDSGVEDVRDGLDFRDKLAVGEVGGGDLERACDRRVLRLVDDAPEALVDVVEGRELGVGVAGLLPRPVSNRHGGGGAGGWCPVCCFARPMLAARRVVSAPARSHLMCPTLCPNLAGSCCTSDSAEWSRAFRQLAASRCYCGQDLNARVPVVGQNGETSFGVACGAVFGAMMYRSCSTVRRSQQRLTWLPLAGQQTARKPAAAPALCVCVRKCCSLVTKNLLICVDVRRAAVPAAQQLDAADDGGCLRYRPHAGPG